MPRQGRSPRKQQDHQQHASSNPPGAGIVKRRSRSRSARPRGRAPDSHDRGRGAGGETTRFSDERPAADHDHQRRRLRRSSVVSASGSAGEPGLSQESGGDLDIGPPSTGRYQAEAAAAAGAAAVEPTLLVEQTPVPAAQTGAHAATGTESLTLTLTPTSALELIQRLEGCVSEEARKLAGSCFAYALDNFERIVQREAFLTLSLPRIEQIIGDDELRATEDVVFNAVMAWVRSDPAQRQHAALDKLLRLVRHPAMSSRSPLLEDELTLHHPELRCSILFQCQDGVSVPRRASELSPPLLVACSDSVSGLS